MLLLTVALLVIATSVSVSQLVAHRYSVSLLNGAAARAKNTAHKLSLEAADNIFINDLVSLQKMLDDQIARGKACHNIFALKWFGRKTLLDFRYTPFTQ